VPFYPELIFDEVATGPSFFSLFFLFPTFEFYGLSIN